MLTYSWIWKGWFRGAAFVLENGQVAWSVQHPAFILGYYNYVLKCVNWLCSSHLCFTTLYSWCNLIDPFVPYTYCLYNILHNNKHFWIVMSPIYRFEDEEKWYWMRQSQAQYHFSEACKLYIGWRAIQNE